MFELSVKNKISDYLYFYAATTPNNEALIDGDQRLTYAQLSYRVNQYAKALLAHGIEKGDRVAVLCTSRIEFWVVFLATNQVGGLWLGLNPKYRLPEIRYVIEDAKPKVIFAMAKFEGAHYGDNIAALQQEYGFIEQTISLTDTLPKTQAFETFLKAAESISDTLLEERQNTIDTMDPALLVYTSGSTGKPKGAVLSNYGLCYGSAVQNLQYQVNQPRFICNFPINHVACVSDTCSVILQAGGTIVFQERFDPALVLATIAKEKISFFVAVPTMLLMLLEHPDFNTPVFESMELVIWGGAAMPAPMIERLQALSPRLMNVYGMTETTANTTHSGRDADLVELSETIGRPNEYMPCRIMNSDGKPCAVGEHGELQFKGDYLLLEYLNRPDATRDVYTEDGWLHTGDLGYWRENGTISLVGRISDMFKSGGYNVYPREIEDVLESHPEIDMAAVVSVPDNRFQEVGAAYLMTLDGTLDMNSLNDFCREHLANYKIPKYFTQVDALPLLPIGKVDKVSLKKRAQQDIEKDQL